MAKFLLILSVTILIVNNFPVIRSFLVKRSA